MKQYLGKFYKREDGGPVCKVVAVDESREMLLFDVNGKTREIDLESMQYYDEVVERPAQWVWLEGHSADMYEKGDEPF